MERTPWQDGLDRVADGLRGEARHAEMMSQHSTLKVGGAAELFIEPLDLEDLQSAVAVLAQEEIPWIVVGGGSNLLVADAGFAGCVISLAHFNALETLPGARLQAGAGVTTYGLTHYACDACLTGLEFMVGIPGTFGGAVAVNAGAHGWSILDRVDTLMTLTAAGVRERGKSELEFGYRFLKLEPGEIVVSAILSLDQGDCAEIERVMEQNLSHRKTVQRVGYPNAGCFFKNPPGQEAWRLIDQAGLRGVKVGGAQVSEVHCNFLVNTGSATATDFLKLCDLIKDRVKSSSGIELEEEVRVVGVL
ncbi:UDP-N-acetylmuramate dehydrogenase [Geomonas sp. RF6]|uniref:UDP-N-acetylmuramate dehydrogenase n=1 Tax=Geomonas sp. RF6 TaxID=2897342 RepID=UPI001E587ACC|nr:UDP-N-acetylmuramate dehydrogenase [Geomonas sp. RF6]UFS71631.1 UDP-N-acetylmuramate dehydrogenase [Geomonas sp. RF6]